MAVLQTFHGDSTAGRDRQTWVLGGLGLCALGGVAEHVGLVDVNALCFSCGDQVHHAVAVVAWVGASHVATRVAVGDEAAIVSDE